MARSTKSQKMPLWVQNMGRLTTGAEADADGVVFPVGMEIADPVPLAIPAGMRAPPSLQEQMAELFRVGRLRDEANREETVDEANDFDIDDYFAEGDNLTPWQVEYDPLLDREISPAEFHEKYKSGELLNELKARFARLDREEDVNTIIERLDTAYRDMTRPKADIPKGGDRPEAVPTSANPPVPNPEKK